jgi:hypothetical protein
MITVSSILARWLYQRISKSAPLHALTIAMFPSGGTFWVTWALFPQVTPVPEAVGLATSQEGYSTIVVMLLGHSC